MVGRADTVNDYSNRLLLGSAFWRSSQVIDYCRQQETKIMALDDAGELSLYCYVSASHGARPMQLPGQIYMGPVKTFISRTAGVFSLAWAPVKGLTLTCSCILSHPLLATACLATLSASLQAMSCLWWQKGLAQFSSPVSNRNKLIPPYFHQSCIPPSSMCHL